MFKKVLKIANLGFDLINKCMPSGMLQLAILHGLKVLVNRNNNKIDNTVLKAYIKKSNLSTEEKATLLESL